MDQAEKVEHGARLRAAMARHGYDRQVIADATGYGTRTVTNWTTGKTMPSIVERERLRELLGEYDAAGDPVEVAVRGSRLHEWRQDAVLSVYKRNLHEQDQEEVRGA